MRTKAATEESPVKDDVEELTQWLPCTDQSEKAVFDKNAGVLCSPNHVK